MIVDTLRCVFDTDMTFTHEGNKTYFDGLVNFEKMVSVIVTVARAHSHRDP